MAALLEYTYDMVCAWIDLLKLLLCLESVCMCVCVCVCACACACVRVHVCAHVPPNNLELSVCVRACACVCAHVPPNNQFRNK